MREIKFRAWDESNFIMRDWEFMKNHLLMPGHSGWKWSEYTGLMDKNGKEGFERDILKSDTGQLLQIIWDNASFVFIDSQGCFVGRVEFHKLILCEIIGNIYENPELWKSK